jgi:hypothetical protein
MECLKIFLMHETFLLHTTHFHSTGHVMVPHLYIEVEEEDTLFLSNYNKDHAAESLRS